MNPPVVLSFSAFDPSGCGGIQADIETSVSLGCHCTPLATSLCTSASANPAETVAVESTLLIEQARSILEDMSVKAIKLGFLGSIGNVEAVHSILHDYPDIPVTLHPALNLWDSSNAEQADLPQALSAMLLPLTDVAIFPHDEALIIAPEADNIEARAQAILTTGCDTLLITGSKPRQGIVRNSCFDTKGLIKHYQWGQVPPSCHGSSSTLSTAISAYLAHGCNPCSAIEQGQNYTWQCLANSRQISFSKRTPNRLFWADHDHQVCQDLPAGKSTH